MTSVVPKRLVWSPMTISRPPPLTNFLIAAFSATVNILTGVLTITISAVRLVRGRLLTSVSKRLPIHSCMSL